MNRLRQFAPQASNIIQLIIFQEMRRIKEGSTSHIPHTPVKKWMHMRPDEVDLVFVQSEESNQHEIQLFQSLILHEEISSQTPSQSYESESSSQECSSSLENSNESTPQQTHQEDVRLKQIVAQKEEGEMTWGRKGCNCRSSKCQKNYCDCFRMGLVCMPGVCSCDDCHNMEQTENHILNNMRMEEEAVTRGCHCRKSKCLKKYCQCHSSGRKCGSSCQCIQCCNRDENEMDHYDRVKKMMKGNTGGWNGTLAIR